jgi:chorismate mutase
MANPNLFDRPILIAGPCSAESERQVLETATQLRAMGEPIFRAGVWKPRTSPSDFQGVGANAFPWLNKVQQETGLKVAIEVGNGRHAEEAISNGIDVLWVGARTTVNPFTVQEIADAVKGHDIPILIKNPVNPDLGLWIGAFERFQKNGIRQLAAVHRGFSAYERSKYRNKPMWEIAIELKRRNPDLPMICDPSHITGDRELVAQVAQIAIDLNYDGLMIEVHPDPDAALSDRDQQIRPAQLKELLEKMVMRKPEIDSAFAKASLEALREHIDSVDSQILELLHQRMEIVEEIGQFKRENDITILQPERWNEIVATRLSHAKEKGLSDELVFDLIEVIHKASIRLQTDIVSKGVEPESGQSV